MATYTAPTTRASGDLITASIWNTDLVENIKYFKDSPSITALTTSGAATIGTTLTAGTSMVTSVSGVGSITDRANSTTSVEVHIRPLSGKSGYLSFTEDSVADRWVIHSKTGSSTLGIASGSSSSHTDRVAITSGGNVAIGATAKIYLDGTAATGDTYITEVASNNIRFVAGGNNVASFGVGSTANAEFYGSLIVQGAQKFFLDGGTSTYFQYYANLVIDAYVNGDSSLRLYAGTSSTPSSFYGHLAVAAAKKFYLDGGNDTYISETSANNIGITTAGTLWWSVNGSGAIVSSNNPNGETGAPVIDGGGLYMTTWKTTASAANANVANSNYIKLVTSLRANKYDIESIPSDVALQTVMNLRGVTYRSTVDDDKRLWAGFIAEEVEQANPTLATYTEDGALQSVTYDRVTAYLVAVVQQQQAEIDALKARLN
jgi:hypothetical protein